MPKTLEYLAPTLERISLLATMAPDTARSLIKGQVEGYKRALYEAVLRERMRLKKEDWDALPETSRDAILRDQEIQDLQDEAEGHEQAALIGKREVDRHLREADMLREALEGFAKATGPRASTAP